MGINLKNVPKLDPINTDVPDFVPAYVNGKPLKASVLGSGRSLLVEMEGFELCWIND